MAKSNLDGAKSKSDAVNALGVAIQKRREHWRRVVARWQSSGLPQAAFCRRHGIPVWKLASWRKRLAGKPETYSAKFVPVRIVPSAVLPTRLELILTDGRHLRFSAQIDPARLTAIVGALEIKAPARVEGPSC